MAEQEVIPDSAETDPPVEADPPTGESTDVEEPVESDSAMTDVPSEPADVAPAAAKVIDSPPPAARPLKESETEPRVRLHQLAKELVRNRNRRLLVEFLQLRRALQ